MIWLLANWKLTAIGGAVAFALALGGLWQYEKGQVSKARAEIARLEGENKVLVAQVALNARTADIDARRLVNVTRALTGAAEATQEVNNAEDLDSAIDAYLRGLGVVLGDGAEAPPDPGADAGR